MGNCDSICKKSNGEDLKKVKNNELNKYDDSKTKENDKNSYPKKTHDKNDEEPTKRDTRREVDQKIKIWEQEKEEHKRSVFKKVI